METGIADVLRIVWIKYLIDICIIASFMYISRDKNKKKKNTINV